MTETVDDPTYGPGFTIARGVRAKAATAVVAKADLGKTAAPGKDWILHINHRTQVPTIGRKRGPNWTLHIDADGTPSIRGKA